MGESIVWVRFQLHILGNESATVTDFSFRQFPILFQSRWNTTGLASEIEKIDLDSLCREYKLLGSLAPDRHSRNKKYFVGHQGLVDARNPDKPSEKHLAIALWRQYELSSKDGTSQLRLLDYEFPLRAANSDKGLGEVDLLGATADGRLAIVELKVKPRNGGRGESPVHALMEGLRYAAVVQANIGAISAESKDGFGIDVSDRAPVVQILAPENWWSGWCDMDQRTRRVAGPWESGFADLATRLEEWLGITVECTSLEKLSLADIQWEAGGPCLSKLQFATSVALHP